MVGTLFETIGDRVESAVYEVLRGHTPDGLQPSARQIAILRELVNCRGAARAFPVWKFANQLKASARQIKDDVRDLRTTFQLGIGSSRDGEGGGYYLITSKEEAIETARPFIQQAKAEWEIARVLLAPHGLAEWEGQMRLPSAEDLDATADEQKARAATSKTERAPYILDRADLEGSN